MMRRTSSFIEDDLRAELFDVALSAIKIHDGDDDTALDRLGMSTSTRLAFLTTVT